MSEYYLRQYQPDADALLQKHGLRVSDEARALIANTIIAARVLPRDSAQSTSPLPALRSAIKHVTAIQKQVSTPGTRKVRIHARCKKLADTLSNGWIAFSLGVAEADPVLIDRLYLGEVEAIDFPPLMSLLTELEHKWLGALKNEGAPDAVTESLRGRNRGATARTVMAGLFVWKLAGHTGSEYLDHDGLLTGLLPDFLRGLLACCAFRMSDKALHHSIVSQQRVTTARVSMLRKRLAERVSVQK